MSCLREPPLCSRQTCRALEEPPLCSSHASLSVRDVVVPVQLCALHQQRVGAGRAAVSLTEPCGVAGRSAAHVR